MSFFTLLYGDKLAEAPGKKILPADQFSTLLEAKEILERMREEADRYRRETAEECEKLKEVSQSEGFEEGLNAWTDQIALLEGEISRVEAELTPKVRLVALKAAQALLGRELTINDQTIGDIILKNLKAVTDHRHVTVYCHKDDLDKLVGRKEEMKALFERLESFVIQDRDDVEPNGCIIETEAGIINAQWETQIGALERAFQKIAKEEES